MAEAKSKSKTPVVCTLCDKPIATGKPVIIDDDPYHSDCAKAMEQSSGAAEETEEEDAEDEEDAVEDEGDEDEEDEEEDEKPAPRTAKKVAAKAPAKSAKRVVVEDEEEDDEDEDDEEEDDEEEEVVVRPAAKKATAPAKKAAPVKAKAPVVEDDEDEDEDDEEEEEEVVVRPAKKTAVVAKATAKKAPARVAADEDDEYEEEDEPEARPTKAKANGAVKKAAAPKVDNSGWGNPSSEGTKRYFVFQAMHAVPRAEMADSNGPGKPENIIAAAKRLQLRWAKETKATLSEKDKNFSSMNVGWIAAHADELGLRIRHNEEAGTYSIRDAKPKGD